MTLQQSNICHLFPRRFESFSRSYFSAKRWRRASSVNGGKISPATRPRDSSDFAVRFRTVMQWLRPKPVIFQTRALFGGVWELRNSREREMLNHFTPANNQGSSFKCSLHRSFRSVFLLYVFNLNLDFELVLWCLRCLKFKFVSRWKIALEVDWTTNQQARTTALDFCRPLDYLQSK